MASLLGEIHFWTLKGDVVTSDLDIGCHTYHSKGEAGEHDQPFIQERQQYAEDRGLKWILPNRRPEKLRDFLREAEEMFEAYRCIYSEWVRHNHLQMMLNNGAILGISVMPGTGDLNKVFIDKYLVGKLHSNHVVDVVFTEFCIFVSYVEPKLTQIRFSKKFSPDEGYKKSVKLSSLQPKISVVDLIGPSGRRFERKLSCGLNGDLLMIWWKSNQEEVWPWTPVCTDRERANIHVYNFNGSESVLQCFLRTESDPLWAAFSKLRPHQILTIEQLVRKGEYIIDRCVYEILRDKIQRVSVTTIPLKSAVVSWSLSPMEDKLLLGCKDGSLVIYDDAKKVTLMTKGAFPHVFQSPSFMDWHPSGVVLMVGSERCQLQCYDMALSCVQIHLISENEQPAKLLDLSTYFRYQPALQKIMWNPLGYLNPEQSGFRDISHSALIMLDRGPLALLHFQLGAISGGSLSAVELVIQYMKHRQEDEAVKLLLTLNWNTESEVLYTCLTFIFNHLLRSQYCPEKETQIEMSLSVFYTPSYKVSDIVILEYRDRINCLARRFFHYLIRNEQLEKAFLLANDIGSRDLFMDLHYIAQDLGERQLAIVALNKAEEVLCNSPSISCDSDCERLNASGTSSDDKDQRDDSSCSTCSRSHSSSSSSSSRSRNSSGCSSSSSDLDYASRGGDQQNDHTLLLGHQIRKHGTDFSAPSSSQKGTRSRMDMSRVSPSGANDFGAPEQQPLLNKNPETSRSMAQESAEIHRAILHYFDGNSGTSEEDEEGNGTIHVVHFGVV